MNVSFLSADLVAKRQSAGVRWTCFAAITLLLVFGASDDVSAQFTFASDNASNSAYGDGWGSGDNGGSGFTAWNINYGASTGTFIGNPASNGMGTSGIGTTAFGLYATGNAYVEAFRGGFTMNVGDTLSYYWAMNYDAGSGSKGVDFRVDNDAVYNINNNGSSTITAGGSTANANYGTTPMLVTLTRSSGSQYSFSMTSRSGGSTYATTFNQSGAINNLKIYIGNQNDGADQKNIYFNNFSLTNSGVYYNTQTESRALTGGGALVVSNSSTLTLTSDGNTFTGGTTIQSGSTLSVGNGGATGDIGGSIANNGTLTFNRNANTLGISGVISGTGAVNKTGAGGQINLSGNNTYSGATTISGGAVEAQHANALGATNGSTTVNSGAALKLFNAGNMSMASEGLTLNGTGVGNANGALRSVGGTNTWNGAITLGSNSRINADTTGGAGSLTIAGNVAGGNNTLFLGADGANITIGGQISGNGNTQDGIATSVFKDGIGALTLSGANTHAGATLLNEGTILIGNNAAFGTGTVQIHFSNFNATKVLASTDGTARSIGNAMNIFGSNLTLGAEDRAGNLSFSGNVNLGNDTTGNNGRTITTATGTSHTFSGIISGNTANTFTKSGAGSLTLSGSSANTYTGLTTVSGGTLELNKSSGDAIAGATTINSGAVLLLSASNQVDSGSGDTVTLSGGTIRRGGNVSEVFGNLTLTTGSFLDYGASNAAGTIRFGTYTPGSLLTVQNFLPGNKLQFDNSISSTDLNNGSLFSFSNGFTTGTEDGYFTITAIPEPSTYLAAAGLLALFLWPVRRRLIKDAKSILGLRPTGRDRSEAYRQA